MQLLRMIAVLALALSAAPAVGQDQKDEHAGHHSPPTGDSEARKGSADEQGASKSSRAQENMSKLDRLLQQIQTVDDPVEKRRLLSEKLSILLDQVRLIRTEQTPIKVSKKEDDKQDNGAKEAMMKGGMGSMMTMHQKVERRLDMLERMLQQLVEREAAKERLDQR